MARPTRGGSTRQGRASELDAGPLRAVFAGMRDVVLIQDARGIITYCSPAIHATLGYQPSELEGTPQNALLHPSDLATRDELMASLVPGAAPLPPVELRIRARDGEWRWFEVTESNRFDDPDVGGIVTLAHDVTSHMAERAKLLERSLRDPLTGIPNRLALVERLEVALSRSLRSRDIVAVLFCDIDDFKLINDVYGHAFADGVLVEFARRLEQLQRSSDTVARIGGDEFVIVCDGLHDVEESSIIAARIHRVVEEPISIDGRQCVITTSIGIATVDGATGDRIDPTTILRNADVAMYRAKQQGRAHWHRFDAGLAREDTQRFVLEGDLATALDRGELALDYQPIHDLTDRTIAGVEGCLRWEHPTRGTLDPDEFLEAAEQSGMIVPIGAWALRTACRQARRWHDAGWPGWMAMNLSARELVEPDLTSSIEVALAETGLAPGRLWLELSEPVFMRAGRSATEELTDLQGLGVHIGVDGFGTTDTPLARLQQLRTDFFKIDRELVANLTAAGDPSPAGCDMIAALVQIGRALGLSVIAEGIRTELEAALLVERGCRYGQADPTARPSVLSGAGTSGS